MKHHVRVSAWDLTFYPALVAFSMLSLACLPGCGGFSVEAKNALAVAAFAAQERAAAFTPWAKSLDAKDPAKSIVARNFAAVHHLALAKDAKNSADLSNMIQTGGYSKPRLTEVVQALSENMEAMVKEWALATPMLKCNGLTEDEWGVFAQSHLHALEAIAASYQAALDAVKPKPKEPAP